MLFANRKYSCQQIILQQNTTTYGETKALLEARQNKCWFCGTQVSYCLNTVVGTIDCSKCKLHMMFANFELSLQDITDIGAGKQSVQHLYLRSITYKNYPVGAGYGRESYNLTHQLNDADFKMARLAAKMKASNINWTWNPNT